LEEYLRFSFSEAHVQPNYRTTFDPVEPNDPNEVPRIDQLNAADLVIVKIAEVTLDGFDMWSQCAIIKSRIARQAKDDPDQLDPGVHRDRDLPTRRHRGPPAASAAGEQRGRHRTPTVMVVKMASILPIGIIETAFIEVDSRVIVVSFPFVPGHATMVKRPLKGSVTLG
jgi:hypothetical protein